MTKINVWAYGTVEVRGRDGGVEITLNYERSHDDDPMFLDLDEAQNLVNALNEAIS